MPRLDNGQALINHAEFETATRAAPGWVASALEIIATLEARVETGQ